MTTIGNDAARALFLGSAIRRLGAWITLCISRGRERCLLQEMSEEGLRDIGLTRAEVEREAARWPWDGKPRL